MDLRWLNLYYLVYKRQNACRELEVEIKQSRSRNARHSAQSISRIRKKLRELYQQLVSLSLQAVYCAFQMDEITGFSPLSCGQIPETEGLYPHINGKVIDIDLKVIYRISFKEYTNVIADEPEEADVGDSLLIQVHTSSNQRRQRDNSLS